MIQIQNLKKGYGSHSVLKGINLEVKKGEIYGFIGQNGAGKSTTMNILTGLIDFKAGQCIINGKDIKKSRKDLFKYIGYLPEEPRFYLYMNAWEYLDFIGTMGGEDTKEIRVKSEELLKLVKLEEAAKRPIGGYSRGMKQRLGIAVAMYHDPDILLMDEPSSALDPQGRKDVVKIIADLKDRGKTIFLSTHILNDIEKVCDRISILHGGKIILEENLDRVINEYIKPIYDIEFITDLSNGDLEMLRSNSFIEKIVKEETLISVYVKDIEKDSNKLLKEISKIQGGIVSLNLRKSNLEEIYMKVVEEDE